MLAVQPLRHHMRNKKLAAVRVRTGIGHRQRTHAVLVRIAFNFVFKPVTGAPASRSRWIAALNHKIRDDAMKNRAIIKPIPREKYKIVDRFWRFLWKKFHHDF